MLPIPFSNPATYAGHSGVDYPQPRGTLIRASGPGVMGRRTTSARGGITAWVDYDGYPGVAYAHLDNYAHTPAVGTRVLEGDIIAAVGMSGFTTGPHLHSEVYGNATTAGYWKYFDPTRVVGQGGGSGGGSNPLPTIETEYPDMFIANVKGGNFWLCVAGMKAVQLGSGSEARQSGIPILNFPDDTTLGWLQVAWPNVK